MDATRGSQHCERFTHRPVRRVLHEPLARLEMEILQQHHRAQRHGNQLAAGFVAHAIGQRHHSTGRREHVLGPRLVHARDSHALADSHVRDTFTHRIDHTRHLAAGHRRQRRLVAIVPADRPQVVVVNRRERGLDAHLSGTGFRCRPFANS